MAGFFGSNDSTLGGLPLKGGSNDPITQAILSRFPQLRSQPGSGGNTLQGYQWGGLDFGQGQGGIGSISMFEGAKGGQSESITSGLALGTLGKSASQTQPGGATLGGVPVLLPQPQFSDVGSQEMTQFESQTGEAPPEGGSLNLGALLDAGTGAFNFLKGAQPTGGQLSSQAMQQQRAGERDYSNATGSPSGIPQLPSFSATNTVSPNTFQAMQGAPSLAGELDIPFTGFQQGVSPGQVDIAGNIVGFPQQSPGIVPVNLSGQIDPAFLEQFLATGGQGGSGQAIDPSIFQGGPFANGLSGVLQQGPGGFGGNFSDLGALGIGQQGLQGIMGMLGVLQGIQSGNIPMTAGGALSTGQAIATLANFPGVAQALGIAATPLAIFNAAQDPSVQNILGAMLTTYSTASTIAPTVFPSLATLGGQALSAISPAAAAALGIGTGVAAAGITGAVGAGAGLGSLAGGAAAAGSAIGTGGGMAGAGIAGTAGAGAGGATSALGAIAAPLAMITGPYIVAKLIQLAQTMGPDKANARQLANRVENIYGQLPGEIATIQNIPNIVAGLHSGSTPEQAADILRQLNMLQDQYQSQGWESHQKTGGTSVSSVGEGNMQVDLPDVRNALDQLNPYFHMMDVNRLRAQDVLGRAGWTPEMIQQATGRYTGPQEWAMNLNAQKYIGGSHENAAYPDFAPTFNAAFRPEVMGTAGGHWEPGAVVGGEGGSWQHPDVWVPDVPGPEQYTTSTYAPSPGGLAPGFGQTGILNTPFGNVSRSMWDQLAAIQPGNFEQGISQFLQSYGGVTPGMVEMGFGQGLPMDPRTTPAALQYQKQLADYQSQLDAFFKNALTPSPLALPSVETAGLLPSSMTAGLAPSTITGGGLTPEQLEWLRSQGWLA